MDHLKQICERIDVLEGIQQAQTLMLALVIKQFDNKTLACEIVLEAAERTKADLLATQTSELAIQSFDDAIALLVQSIA